MYEICLHVNFMFQFEIKIDYPFTFQKNFFFKISSFGVFTQASGKYLGKYPKNIYLPIGHLPTPYHYLCPFCAPINFKYRDHYTAQLYKNESVKRNFHGNLLISL